MSPRPEREYSTPRHEPPRAPAPGLADAEGLLQRGQTGFQGAFERGNDLLAVRAAVIEDERRADKTGLTEGE